MAAAKPLTTLLSSKGQVILPKSVRETRGWGQGVRLEVVDTEEGVLLRREPRRPPSRLEDVRGILKLKGPDYPPAEVRSGAQAAVEQKFSRIEETGSAYPDEAEA